MPRNHWTALAAGAACLACVSTAQAANLFDDLARLFGRPAAAAVAPSVPLEVTVRPRRAARPSAGSTKPPPPVVKLDPSTDPYWYLADPTLRRGDIVVTHGGVMVYQGRDSDALRRADFVGLSASKAGAKAWQQQLQMAAAGGRSFFRDVGAPAVLEAKAEPSR